MGYAIAWLVWVSAAALVMAGVLFLTRGWRPPLLRDLVRLFVAGTLLVPSTAGSGAEGFYAPAWIVFFFESFLQAEGDPVPAMMSLMVGWALALAVLIGLTAVRFFRHR